MHCGVLVATLASLIAAVSAQTADVQVADCQIMGIDLVFVIDSSSSITFPRFLLVRRFAAEIAELLEIGPQQSLAGVIQFSTSAQLQFDLIEHTDQPSLLAALARLPYLRGNTNTAGALNLLLQSAQDGRLGLRMNHPHVAIVITDGESNIDKDDTVPAAERLHASGIFDLIYSVGVGNFDRDEVRAIASDPSLVFTTRSFDRSGIQQLQDELSKRLCSDTGMNGTGGNGGNNDTKVMGDPHFMVPLVSGDHLCYSIQGYPGLVFNLIYNHNYIINALFVDSYGDENDATWIGKLAVVPKNSNKSEAVIFDSVNQEVIIHHEGHFAAAVIEKITFDEIGKIFVKFTQGVTKQTGNPTIHVEYAKPFASFDVSFHENHLDVDWYMKYDDIPEMHGLMGQFMVKGVAVDPIKKMLTHPDMYSHDPVAVELDDVMTGKTCWKAMNPGNQGEGLIEGNILDYMVSTLLIDDFKLKNF